MQTETMTFVREAVVTYRRRRVRVPMGGPVIDELGAARIARRVIPDGPAEHFIVLALDSRNEVQAWATIGIGGLSSCPVDVRAVLRFVLCAGCERFICAHNHPSGRPDASGDDVAITDRLRRAAETIGLQLLDHVIVTPDAHFSLRSAGLLAGDV